jgi:flagellar basal body P-ring protein FlgI
MRRLRERRIGALVAWALIATLGLSGAGKKGKLANGPPPKVEENIASLAYVAASKDMELEGVGLVSGLPNTGVDPPPSHERQKLVDEMRKAGVVNPNKVLADPRFAMVIVRLKLNTGATTHDRIDVELEVPPGSGTTSLAGGYLMTTRLREVGRAGDRELEGHELALAEGPVMPGTEAKPNDLKRGRVLGGARPKKDFPYNLVIKENRKSVRTASIIEKAVNARFHQTEGIEQKGMAKAETDQFLVLNVPRVYRHYPGRYFEVVKRIALVDSPELRAVRLEGWGRQLLDPATAGAAALCLEGMGPNAIDSLKKALPSGNAQVRFFAAEALAYLNDASGSDVLASTAVNLPEFRGVALNALAALDQPAAHLKLRKLMDEPDIDVRYGAFNALRTLDPQDPFLGRVRVLEEPPRDPDEGDLDPTAISTRRTALSRSQPDPFALYLVDTEGPPMVHVARTRRCEIVIFGRGQKLLTPVVVGSGALQVSASDGDESVQISKILPSRYDDGEQKFQCPLELGDVVRRMANLGASYPEIVSILQAANQQKNLAGPLVVDRVPGVSQAIIDAVVKGKDVSKKDENLQRTKGEVEEPAPRKGLFSRFRRTLRND